MKNSFALLIASLFLSSFLFAQKNKCREWISKDNDPALNKKAAELLNNAFQNKSIKGTYLRHSIKLNWEITKNELDVPVRRSAEVSFLYKDEDGTCKSGTTWLIQDHKSGGKYGEYYIVSPLSENNVDCNCTASQTNWLSNEPVQTKDPLDSNK